MRRHFGPLGRVRVAQSSSELSKDGGVGPCLHLAHASDKRASHFDTVQAMNIDGVIASIQ